MKLFYEEMGSGFPIILIHGFPFDHTIFMETAGKLKNSARVILPDLRGFGKSSAGYAPVTLHDMAADLHELMDELGLQKAILGGHSMGGYLSVDFCRSYPERVAGLALIASHAAADTEEQRQARLKNIEKIRNGQAREFLMEGMAPKLTKYPELAKSLNEMMVKTPDGTLIGCLQSMAERTDVMTWLKESGIPAAMICGEDDMIMPLARAEEMAKKMGADPLVRVPAAGHMLMLENPEMTAKGLLEFLRRVEENK